MKTAEEYLAENNLSPTEEKLKTFMSFVREAQREGAADECSSCQKILEGVADILHNRETGHSPLKAYGLTQTTHMKAAAKVLRELATSLRVREIKLREGNL